MTGYRITTHSPNENTQAAYSLQSSDAQEKKTSFQLMLKIILRLSLSDKKNREKKSAIDDD